MRPPAASADLLREIRDGYESLDRVLVLDASRGRDGLNGVGNLFGDYIVWFAAAAAALYTPVTELGRKALQRGGGAAEAGARDTFCRVADIAAARRPGRAWHMF